MSASNLYFFFVFFLGFEITSFLESRRSCRRRTRKKENKRPWRRVVHITCALGMLCFFLLLLLSLFFSRSGIHLSKVIKIPPERKKK